MKWTALLVLVLSGCADDKPTVRPAAPADAAAAVRAADAAPALASPDAAPLSREIPAITGPVKGLSVRPSSDEPFALVAADKIVQVYGLGIEKCAREHAFAGTVSVTATLDERGRSTVAVAAAGPFADCLTRWARRWVFAPKTDDTGRGVDAALAFDLTIDRVPAAAK